MSELQDSLQLITEKGTTVLAITPEVPESIDKMEEESNASFSIIHDGNYELMKRYKTAFIIDDKLMEKYRNIGVDVKVQKANQNENYILPVPATYVISKDGLIDYAYFNTNYKERASVKEILRQL